MKVPLSMEVMGNTLWITRNKKVFGKELPLKPYVIAEKENDSLKSEPVELIRIPDNQRMVMQKISAKNLENLEEKTVQLKAESERFHKLPYMEHLFTDLEDYPLQFANTDPLKVMYLDIEVETKGDGIFPRAERAPIIAIGVAIDNGEVVIFDDYDEKVKKKEDTKILTDFLAFVKKQDPDVIVTYNGIDFDIPYIVTRMKKCKLEPAGLNRQRAPIMYKDEIRFRGRVHFDCIIPARKDQSLFGIKSRGLKDVSKWYGHEAIEFGEDIGNTRRYIRTPEMRTYLTSDVEATRTVSNVYLPNAITLAEMMKVPLGSIVGCFPSFIPKLLCSRYCRELGMMPLENNKGRYGSIDKDGNVTEDGRMYTLGSKFQGAIVNIKKTGYFPKVTKVDYISMYPSAIRTWNLGPDTTRITDLKDYTGEYKFTRTPEQLVLEIPDENFNKNVVVTIDMTKTGFLKAEIERLGAERKRLKKLMKETNDKGEYAGYDSRQQAIKVIMNSIFGYTGSQYATYGDMATGLTITGMCRWLTAMVIDEVGDALIETDTDGLVVDRKIDYESINVMMAERIRNEHDCDCYMELEEEPLLDAYFYKMKNYVIRMEKKGKIVMEKHGVAMKSSKQSKICDRAIDEVATRVLDRELEEQYEFSQELKRLSRYNLVDFRYRTTFTKNLKGYGDRVSLQRVVGIQVEHRLKTKVAQNMQVEFYVTKKPPDCPPLLKLYEEVGRKKGPYYSITQYVDSVDQLDEEYYTKQIDKICEVFGWDNQAQLSLDL